MHKSHILAIGIKSDKYESIAGLVTEVQRKPWNRRKRFLYFNQCGSGKSTRKFQIKNKMDVAERLDMYHFL